MSDEWIENLKSRVNRQIDVGKELLESVVSRDTFGIKYNVLSQDIAPLAERWIDASVVVVRECLGDIESEKLKNKSSKYPRSYSDEEKPITTRVNACLSELQNIYDIAVSHPDQLLFSDPALSEMKRDDKHAEGSEDAFGDGVFVIHGHDELNTLRLKNFLSDELKISSVVLSSKAGKGRTLIEKFEDEASKCGFAFALLTPDDLIQTENGEYAQARPNVVFELGWFYGRRGRSRVCLLLKKGTQIHSDLDGINRVEFEEDILHSSEEIRRELVAAGLLSNDPE